MSDTWDERRKAKEDEFFAKENQKALQKLKSRAAGETRKSPITGEPMEQITIMGVTVDRCPTSGGVWLDKGELDQILEQSKESAGLQGFFKDLFSTLK